MSINSPGPNPRGPAQKYPYSGQPITNDPKGVDQGHQHSDVDSSKFAQHHTLGHNAGQASPGNHIHDGSQSKQIPASSILELDSGGVVYTPSWTASTTNPTIGNGSVAGRYIALDKLIIVAIRVNFGSTTAPGSGSYMFSLPFAVSPNLPVNWIATGITFNGSITFAVNGYLSSGNNTIFAVYDSFGNRMTGAGVGSSAWVSGNFILLNATYEAA